MPMSDDTQKGAGRRFIVPGRNVQPEDHKQTEEATPAPKGRHLEAPTAAFERRLRKSLQSLPELQRPPERARENTAHTAWASTARDILTNKALIVASAFVVVALAGILGAAWTGMGFHTNIKTGEVYFGMPEAPVEPGR